MMNFFVVYCLNGVVKHHGVITAATENDALVRAKLWLPDPALIDGEFEFDTVAVFEYRPVEIHTFRVCRDCGSRHYPSEAC